MRQKSNFHKCSYMVISVLFLVLPFFLASTGESAQSGQLFGPDKVPPGLTETGWEQIQDQIHIRSYRVIKDDGMPHTYSAPNPVHRWNATFTEKGAIVSPKDGKWTWGLELAGYGYDRHTQPITGSPGIVTEDNKLTYRWDDILSEYYLNDANGLEQVFVLTQRPAGYSGTTPLRVDMKICGNLGASAAEEGIHFITDDGLTALTYTKLHVFDADGRTLPARFAVKNASLTIEVDDAAAAYPLTIDPLIQQAYIKASNTGAGDAFGYSVSVSGDTAIVGAYLEDSNGTQTDDSVSDSGAAYIFVRSGSTWSQQAYLKASNIGTIDRFGCAVSIYDDTAVVGALFEDSNATGVNGDGSNDGAIRSGAAYVFVRSGTTWTQQAYLKASNTGAFDYFGCSVSISGETILVGAYGEDSNGIQINNSINASGAAYVFVRSGTTWTQQAYLKASSTISDLTAYDHFGYSVSISGNTAIIGAYQEDSNATGVGGNGSDNSVTDSGAAYVFTRSGTVWSRQAYLKASNTGADDYFGYSVSISGNTAIVGAYQEDSNATGVGGNEADNSAADSGAAYVFTYNGVTWSQQEYLKASNTEAGDRFGYSVSISEDTAIVGADYEDSNATGINGDESNNSAVRSGAAYLFSRTVTTWIQRAFIKASNTGGSDYFGRSVCIFKSVAIVGAEGEDSNSQGIDQADNNSASNAGAAYAFDVRPYPGPGKTLDLDGADEYVTVSNASSAFNLTDGTIEMWVKPDWASGANGGENPCIIALRNDTSARYSLHISDNLGGIGLYDGTAYNSVAYTFTQGKWYHVAFVESGADTSVYIDGILIGTTGNAFSAATPSALTIGWSNDSAQTNEYFTGQIDEVRIWSSVRTLADIRDNMCKKITGSEAALVAYYRFDQSSDTDLPDYTGNGYNGAAQNIEDPGDWVYSGASIGDDSAHDYIGAPGTPGDFSATIASSRGDNIAATGDGGSAWKGIQVYRVDGRANDLTAPGGLVHLSEEVYWGVHVAAGASAPTYELVHTYTGHRAIIDESELDLAKRDNAAAAGWTETNAPLDTATDTLTLAGQAGTEFILGSNTGDNTLSVSLAYFNVISLNGRTILEWVTESEIDNAGFYILRSTDPNGPFERITSLIPSTGTPLTRSSYLYADLNAYPGQTYYYRLEDVNDSGSSTIHNATDDPALSGCKGYDLTGDGGTGLDDVIFLLRILTGGAVN